MDCADLTVLHRLLDDDLDEAQAELVAHHLESCAGCRTAFRDIAELRSFVQDRLGVEDEGEDDVSATALAEISRHLPMPPIASPGGSPWWRRNWFAAASIAVLALLLPLPFVPSVSAWPARILEEAATRQRMWMYRPNRVLHWEVESVSNGVQDLEDGRWRTVFWQSNGATSFAQMSRQFDPQGRTSHAYWQQADGGTISYRSKAGQVVEISPSTEVAQNALPTLTPELRAALESYLARRHMARSLDFNSRRESERLHRPTIWASGGTVTLRRGLLDRWGGVHQILVENGPSELRPTIVRSVHEYDIQSSTLRLLRLKSTITYTDGTVGIHDSRWIFFEETSTTEFNAQTPRDLLESGMPVVRLTPQETSRRHLLELNRAVSN